MRELLHTDKSGQYVGFRDLLLLEKDEVPVERIAALKQVADQDGDIENALIATYLLAAWGDRSYVDKLKQYCENRINQKGNISPHRLRNYDQTYEYFLESLIGYWCTCEEAGSEEAEGAREYIFPVIVLIIQLANEYPFELTALYGAIKRGQWLEYLPHIKSHLEKLFKFAEQHQWKYVDAINFLDQYDEQYVTDTLSRYGKSRSDFPLEK